MKKIGIVITDPEDWTARALTDAARKKGFSPFVLDFKAAEVSINSAAWKPRAEESNVVFKVGDLKLSDFDAIIVRDAGAGAFEGVSFRFDILRELEDEGVPVVNSPEAIRNAANKYHSSYLLAKAGLPVPKTVAVQDMEAALKVISRFGDAVIKPVFGYKGKDIARVRNGEVQFSDRKMESSYLESVLKQLLQERGMLYIQEFIENPRRDIRAFIVDGKAIGAIYRKAASGSWVNNLSQGGSADRCVLTEKQKEIAEKAALAVSTTFAGVDIIEGLTDDNLGEGLTEDSLNKKLEVHSTRTEGNPKVLEVNGTPSGKGIFDAWGINPAEYILEYIEKTL
ncbi:Tetrahydromethanopterin:alpha-L-glutamate ligase [Methanosarcina barkeri 3]|uniref:Tetrahydromethanopterin:alpha-L-glutamate ligase n=1 Tax=Methanosarcina barkeri 3 TaxID=1434107 RepID=A0A0E3SEM7_METBA|nr:tetrahydromethanopterin:alpha-L-glutamate ligase [Methanosarcina barkeri]AKB80644.1 Tetrahydromethanopterin:alpha-L-glutamate ligase [Methanosarcina barkeri 3]